MALSGQKTITAAGTAEALGDQVVNAPLAIKALPTNTGIVYIGNNGSGDVESSNGYPLAAREAVVFEYVANLTAIRVDAVVSGEGVAWVILGT